MALIPESHVDARTAPIYRQYTDVETSILAGAGELLGRKTPVSRGGRRWFFSVRPDGLLPADGAVPPVIDWGPRGCPAPDMPDLGARLVGYEIEHPDWGGVSWTTRKASPARMSASSRHPRLW